MRRRAPKGAVGGCAGDNADTRASVRFFSGARKFHFESALDKIARWMICIRGTDGDVKMFISKRSICMCEIESGYVDGGKAYGGCSGREVWFQGNERTDMFRK